MDHHGILDLGHSYEEAAVDAPNRRSLTDLPDWLVVEAPATVDVYKPVEEMLDTMLKLEAEHLGRIR